MSINLTPQISANFLNDIKTQTADSHKKLESLPVSAAIISPNLKIAEYIHYLSLMHDVHSNIEETIFPLLATTIDDLEWRKKKHLIEEDLRFLNYNKISSTNVFELTNTTIPFALGILYVIEGSTLGGRFILRNISTVEGLDTNKGVSYFTGYGDKTGSNWKSFLSVLEEYEQINNCGDSIIEGAKFAFDSIYNHFRITEINED